MAGSACLFYADQLDDQAATPSILLLGEAPDGGGERRLRTRRHNPGVTAMSPSVDAKAHSRFRADVPHPVRALTPLGHEIVASASAREPDLDLTRQSGSAARGSQVQKRRLRVRHARLL
jgi:hypothetical protein